MFDLPTPHQPVDHHPPAEVRRADPDALALPRIRTARSSGAGIRAVPFSSVLGIEDLRTALLHSDFLRLVPAPKADAFNQIAFQPPNPAPEAAPSGPQPLPARMGPAFYDGAFIGADGKVYSSSESLASIPRVQPWLHPNPTGGTIIFVNGISTPLFTAQYHTQSIANVTGIPVVGIYNATNGDINDVLQVMGDKANVGTNNTVQTLTREIVSAVHNDQPLHLLGESHGALILSRSLRAAISSLKKAGWADTDIESRLSKIRVETFGGSAWSYPDGPRYVHYINELDPVPFHFGLTPYGLKPARLQQIESHLEQPDWIRRFGLLLDVLDVDYLARVNPGRDARIIRFNAPPRDNENWIDTHMVETYLRHHKPFDQAYLQPPAEPAPSDFWQGLKTTAKWLLVTAGVYLMIRGVRNAFRAVKRFFNPQKAAGDQEAS